jgi:hypothetical protein
MELAPEHGQPATTVPAVLSDRARSVVKGLIATGRAERVKEVAAEDMILLRRLAATDQFYWVAQDGDIRSGANLVEAEPLQPGFVAAMARAGARP